jgi:hypothetical protein
MLFAQQVLKFLSTLEIKDKLPKGVMVLNPYQHTEAKRLCKIFYRKYYSDNHIRRIILGINPGRLGGGLTGIPFTDPIHLERYCGIQNTLDKKLELSSTFVYEMINACGGPEVFYSKLYFSSLSPLGFIKDDKNLNYYDDVKLQKTLEPFMIDSINKQLQFNIDRSVAYCLGEGQNYKYVSQLNEKNQFFTEIIPLAHPRFIMQYKRRQKEEYINRYKEAFKFIPEKAAS